MDDPSGSLGANIRRRRQTLGLSLDALAQQSEVSSTMLSEVERSVKNPTVRLAYQIARALGCSLTDLLEDRSPTPVQITRADQRRTLVDPTSQVVRHGLTSQLASRQLEVVWYSIPSGQTTGEMGANRPGVLEHLIAVRGCVSVLLGGKAYDLEPGDSITYGPQVTTEYSNRHGDACEIVLLSDSSRANDI
ncbi:MAG: helix-turn-helix domain-containing protein [Myxococcales bacterium FL481]|nr:MAG: helix-turn-helix domain-containing protein [Myxococcales bacterium FL481]